LFFALTLVAALTLARLLALFTTPLELYPDEAQYWLWSRTLDFGYYSKPPMVAWLIALTTAIGGDAEPWVRVSALWLHGGAALALYAGGARLYDGWTGFWAAALYMLMPGVQLSALVIATDAPLLLFLSLALLAYVALTGGRRDRAALALGAALGAAALSKYAAAYFIVGLALHAATSREARQAWSPRRLGLAAAAFAAVLGPNLAWNAVNGFATVSHTAANASWGESERFQVAELLDFLASQLGVFGPLPFLVLLAGGVALVLRRRLTQEDRLLLCLTLPPLLIVSAQAFATRANANWAVAAYAPASVLVAAWLVRWRSRWLLGGAAASQGALAVVFLLGVAAPSLADAVGAGNALKRARGWRATTDAVMARASAEPGLTAIAVDDRFLFNAFSYYGRERLAAPTAPPLTMWVREAAPQNQAESTHPLTPALGRRVLAVSLVEDFRGELKADFDRVIAARDAVVPLDPERTRAVQTFIGEGFAPRPRDPVTGLPTPRPRAP
jgi:4-amino-4-deoxy-L-arabinose transferase-like glycosyltransferase